MHKKGISQLGVWFVGIILIFAIMLIYTLLTPSVRLVNSQLEPLANGSYMGVDYGEEIFQPSHKNYAAAFIILIGGILFIMMLSLFRQDPNSPYD